MRTQKKYSQDTVEAIASKLREMPVIEKKKEYSRKETIKVLSKDIAALQKKGYSLEQISETLRGEGLDISNSTLKSYLQEVKSTGKKKPESKKDTPPSSPPASSNPSKATFTPRADTQDL